MVSDPSDTCPPCHNETLQRNSPPQTPTPSLSIRTWSLGPHSMMGRGHLARGPQTPAGTHLIQVVVGLGLLKAEGLPELGRQPSQELIEDVVVPLVSGLWSGGWVHRGEPPTQVTPMNSRMNCIDCVSLLKPQTVFDSFSFMLEVFSAWHLMVGWSEVDELPGTVAQA